VVVYASVTQISAGQTCRDTHNVSAVSYCNLYFSFNQVLFVNKELKYVKLTQLCFIRALFYSISPSELNGDFIGSKSKIVSL
jgi:hypothetical protein